VRRLIAVIFAISLAAPASAQVFGQLQVQDTFESKDVNPATIALVWPHNDQKSYSYVDLAIKYPFKELHPLGVNSTLIPSVAVEWHRYEAEALLKQDQTSKLAPEVMADLALGDVACGDTGADMSKCHRIRPFITAKYAMSRDFITDEWDGTFSSLVSPFSIHPGFPGAWYPRGDRDKRVLLYNPSTGFERFENPAIIGDGDAVVAPAFAAWTFTVLLDAQIYPFNALPSKPEPLQRVSLGFKGSFRKTLSGDLEDSTLNALTLSATYYFDSANRFGLSLTHDNGKSPVGNFVGRRRDVLALSIKISPE
jgi:hypothetical protein